MSGICGIIYFDEQSVKKEAIQTMLDAMKNRGSDSEEIWIDKNVGFGHKMLWTTPESLHENQPLISEKDNLVLVADARIDNRDELFEKLEINQKDFNVITDIDLIMHSYLKWGENCTQYLIGDFSFVIWDEQKKSCFLIRDHMGIKPLYYFCDDTLFAYASEIAALFTINEIPKNIDQKAIDRYHDLTALECDKTFFSNIMRVKPAHMMILKKKQLRDKRYWYPETISSNYTMSFDEAKSGFKDVLSKAILARTRRVSGPIGCELSGGLDSSSVVVLANELTTDKILTFSTTFEGLECNDKDYIDSVLDKTGLRGFFTQFNKDDYRDKYPFTRCYEYSLDWVGRSMFSFFFESMEKAKEQNVKVILTGFGADEVLSDRTYALSDLLRHFHLKSLYIELKSHTNPIRSFLLYGLFPLLPEKIIKMAKFMFPHIIFDIILRVRNDFKYICYSFKSKAYKPFTELYNLKTIISNDLDEMNTLSLYRFSERFNLEFRHPFLDKRVIEYILSVPSYYKYSSNKKKNLLRETLKDLLPENIYLRMKDVDFSELTSFNVETYLDFKLQDKTCYNNWHNCEIIYWKSKCLGKINEKE